MESQVIAEMKEKIGALAARSEMQEKQIDEIFRMIHETNATVAVQANANAQSALNIQHITEAMKQQHTPESCPMRPKVEKFALVLAGIAAVFAVLTFLGWGNMIGGWILTQHK